MCPSWSDRAGSPDPSRVLLLVLFAVLEPAGGNPAGGTSWGRQAGREGQRCLRATSSSLLFRPRAGGGGHGWGLQCPFAVALPVISLCAARGRDWGRGAGCRLPLSSLESACSQRELKRPREQSTSCVSGLCRGHKHCRTPPVPPSHSPGGLRPASCVEPRVLLAQVWGANAVGVPSKEVQGSFGAGVRSCSDAKGRLQVCRQPLPACRSRSWLESSGENCPSWCKEPGSVPVSALGDAGHSHSTEILVPWVHYGTLGHTETPQDTGTLLPIASSLG